MKTQAEGQVRKYARFDAEYKREALKLWRSSERSAAKVAAELGIRPELLYKWARVERGPVASEAEGKRSRPSVDALEAEVQRLRVENAKLLEQREVLKNERPIQSGVAV